MGAAMSTYEGEVHCRLHGPVAGAFKGSSNWYGRLEVDERGTCTAAKADGSPYAQAPACNVRYQQVRIAVAQAGPRDQPIVVLDFPGGESITVDFARGRLKEESPLKRVADVITMSAMKAGWAERDRFLEALASNGGEGSGTKNVY
jgi:hypothetical protein